MINKNQRIMNIINKLLDLFILVVLYVFSASIWRYFFPSSGSNIAFTYRSPWVFPILFSLITFFTYEVCGIYEGLRSKPIREDVTNLLKSTLIAFAIIFASFYALHFQDFSRGIMGTYFISAFLGILCKRLLMRYLLQHYAILGYTQRNILVIGSGKLAQEYCQSIRNHPEFGIKVSGYFGDENSLKDEKYLGPLNMAEKFIKNPEVDEIVIALEESHVEEFPAVFAEAERSGKKTSIISIYNQYLSRKASIDVIGNVKMINISESPLDYSYNYWVKRIFDILFSGLLLVVLSPILLITAIGVKCSSPGPIIFRQERVGYNGKQFVMYKFRSMRVNAKENTAWTKNSDPRKTAFGSFIRKTSIDELPQIFNVFKGDMSFIGPRPEVPHFVEEFSKTIPHYMIKHRVMPGITGWAQVNGYRGDTSIEERIKCDIWYIENWSIGLDIRIIFMTIFGGLINKEKLGNKQ